MTKQYLLFIVQLKENLFGCMSTLFFITVFHALGFYSTPWSHREEEGPHPIEVLQVRK